MSKPVTPERIAIATEQGIDNAEVAALACREAGLPYWAACALLDKESNGQNVFGHDEGGVHSYPDHRVVEVTPALYIELLVKVMNGETSNGVGPTQVTWAGNLVGCQGGNGRNGGFFKEMSEQHLLPWDVHDNMLFGFKTLADARAGHDSWYAAARIYNGKESYGRDFVNVANQWRDRLHIDGGPVE